MANDILQLPHIIPIALQTEQRWCYHNNRRPQIKEWKSVEVFDSFENVLKLAIKKQRPINQEKYGHHNTNGEYKPDIGVGIGIFTGPTNTGICITALDIDHCIVDGQLVPDRKTEIEKIIALIPSYWEISPSGLGLHGFCLGTTSFNSRLTHVKNIELEIYSGKHYITISGTPFGLVKQLSNCQTGLDNIINLYSTTSNKRFEGINDADTLKNSAKYPTRESRIRAFVNAPQGEHRTLLMSVSSIQAIIDQKEGVDRDTACTKWFQEILKAFKTAYPTEDQNSYWWTVEAPRAVIYSYEKQYEKIDTACQILEEAIPNKGTLIFENTATHLAKRKQFDLDVCKLPDYERATLNQKWVDTYKSSSYKVSKIELEKAQAKLIQTEKDKKRPNWHAKIQWADNGNSSKMCESNVITALTEHPDLVDAWAWDNRNYCVNLMKAPPWSEEGTFPRAWDAGKDLILCIQWLANLKPSIITSATQLQNLLNPIAQMTRSYDPWLEYLKALVWDDVPRLDTYMTDLGATSPLANIFFRKWLISAVARAFIPGCQVDHMLVLFSKDQGVGKSSLLRALVPDPDLHASMRSRAGDKDASMQLIKPVIVEDSELSSYNRSQLEALKDFLTETKDTFRPPYGRDVVSYPRRCVLCATTNNIQFISDDTGGRRFWPITFTKDIEIQKIIMEREQIWGEAVKAYLSGETWYFTDNEENKVNRIKDQILELQENHSEDRDNIESELSDKLEQTVIAGQYGLSGEQIFQGKIQYISNFQACQLLPLINGLDPRMQKRVTKALLHLGWNKARMRKFMQKWYFFKPVHPEPPSALKAARPNC
jgi:Virulence-associated protein E